ncbi:hypothetical protein ADL19_14835 [Streptomyces purpurogeneiscleroticus]|nr:hypothetical protein ADL19_14835 [Streptomyces purpurogeneiscleroticus]
MSAKRNSAEKFLTGEEFDIWLKSRQITLGDAAEWLGVTKQTVTHYKKAGINKTQALAIAAIERGIKPWEPTDEDRQRAEGIPSE